MRIRATQKSQVQYAGQLDIVDIAADAGNQVGVFDPFDGCANEAVGCMFGCHDYPLKNVIVFVVRARDSESTVGYSRALIPTRVTLTSTVLVCGGALHRRFDCLARIDSCHMALIFGAGISVFHRIGSFRSFGCGRRDDLGRERFSC